MIITTGLMKSEELAAALEKDREQRAREAVMRLDPEWPYATLPFPEGFGVMEEDSEETETSTP